MNAETLEALEAFEFGPTRLFVDSGAFSEVTFNREAGRLEIAKPLTAEHWRKGFATYRRLAPIFRSRLYVVAPDCVGHQAETIERWETYADEVRELLELGANVIVPLRKGSAIARRNAGDRR